MSPVFKAWLSHLISAGVSGAANSLGAAFIDPSSFNFTSAKGWEHIGGIALFGFVVPVIRILQDGLPTIEPVTPPVVPPAPPAA